MDGFGCRYINAFGLPVVLMRHPRMISGAFRSANGSGSGEEVSDIARPLRVPRKTYVVVCRTQAGSARARVTFQVSNIIRFMPALWLSRPAWSLLLSWRHHVAFNRCVWVCRSSQRLMRLVHIIKKTKIPGVIFGSARHSERYVKATKFLHVFCLLYSFPVAVNGILWRQAAVLGA